MNDIQLVFWFVIMVIFVIAIIALGFIASLAIMICNYYFHDND